jgi:hypothetical protein
VLKTEVELNFGGIGDHGGATWTIPLLAGSHAIDAGDNAVCNAAPVNKVDQRGTGRNQGVRCDVGAFEFVYLKTTFKSQGINDGWVLESTETSGKGGTKNHLAASFNLGDDASKKQYRGILSFNTAGLPDDAVIAKVTLRLKSAGVVGGGNPITTFGGFMVDLKKGPFGTSLLALGDFSAQPDKIVGPFKPGLKSGWYAINLTVGKAQVNTAGLTQLRLRFKLDDNNNLVSNFLKLYSGDAGVASRPQLIIEYYVP